MMFDIDLVPTILNLMDIPINLSKVKREIEDDEVSFKQVENCFTHSEIKKGKAIDEDFRNEKKNQIEKVYIKEEVYDDWDESPLSIDPLPVSPIVEDETNKTENTMEDNNTILGVSNNFPSISQRRDKYMAMKNIGLQPVNLVVAELGTPPPDKNTSCSSSHRCERCGKTYKNLDGLRKHRKLYCGQKPQFLCLMCPKKFYQKIHVRSHMFSVHGKVTV